MYEALEFDNFIRAGKVYDKIILNYPENFKELITSGANECDESEIKSFYHHVASLLIHQIINVPHSDEELNYFRDIRTFCSKQKEMAKVVEPISKLSPAQMEKYGKTPPSPPLSRVIREGTDGDCPSCKSTTLKRFKWFGMSMGCIQPKCENYYKQHQILWEKTKRRGT